MPLPRFSSGPADPVHHSGGSTSAATATATATERKTDGSSEEANGGGTESTTWDDLEKNAHTFVGGGGGIDSPGSSGDDIESRLDRDQSQAGGGGGGSGEGGGGGDGNIGGGGGGRGDCACCKPFCLFMVLVAVVSAIGACIYVKSMTDTFSALVLLVAFILLGSCGLLAAIRCLRLMNIIDRQTATELELQNMAVFGAVLSTVHSASGERDGAGGGGGGGNSGGRADASDRSRARST